MRLDCSDTTPEHPEEPERRVYDRAMSAVDAAVAVADAHGVRCEKPIVLSEAWHVLVHLWPSPVVARVTSGAPGVDPADVERELTVAGHAARAGAPVVRPSDLLPPGPHRREGYTLVFWRYLGRTGELDPAVAGRGLRRIHDSLVDYAGDLPRAGRAAEVRAMLVSGTTLRPRATAHANTTLPRLSSTTARGGQIRRLGWRSRRMGPTTRTSSSRRSRSMPPGWPRRS
jgi:hypothetical protein